MDKDLEKKNAEEVRKLLARQPKNQNFKRTKSTFYTRTRTDRIDFIHLHKFTFGPRFRVHIGARFLCDTIDVVALNGIDSDSFKTKYIIEYSSNYDSVVHCVDEMINFIKAEGFQWFEEWSNTTRLLNFNNSPIKNYKDNYFEFVGSKTPEEVIVQSYKVVGIKSLS